MVRSRAWLTAQSRPTKEPLIKSCFLEVAFPQGLNPIDFNGFIGTNEVVPFQSTALFRGSLTQTSPEKDALEQALLFHPQNQRPMVTKTLRWPASPTETPNVMSPSGVLATNPVAPSWRSVARWSGDQTSPPS